ncbi:hypothetical protein SISSUDRAFT_1066103 [Sistotremastrum suecicum HHB10207 ss-3]|uniref:F-box domain-containing protein n=1 Tax=Sistotremastrum suecicum HHB10207 ss-3 TaxID=1314776 RepID=A0A165YPW2_9AGAM|nr:hypothetical protein SISSUDRAFT_1066103 [Sistotremastrum suecicum HHB10207 ss-3]
MEFFVDPNNLAAAFRDDPTCPAHPKFVQNSTWEVTGRRSARLTFPDGDVLNMPIKVIEPKCGPNANFTEGSKFETYTKLTALKYTIDGRAPNHDGLGSVFTDCLANLHTVIKTHVDDKQTKWFFNESGNSVVFGKYMAVPRAKKYVHYLNDPIPEDWAATRRIVNNLHDDLVTQFNNLNGAYNLVPFPLYTASHKPRKPSPSPTHTVSSTSSPSETPKDPVVPDAALDTEISFDEVDPTNCIQAITNSIAKVSFTLDAAWQENSKYFSLWATIDDVVIYAKPALGGGFKRKAGLLASPICHKKELHCKIHTDNPASHLNPPNMRPTPETCSDDLPDLVPDDAPRFVLSRNERDGQQVWRFTTTPHRNDNGVYYRRFPQPSPHSVIENGVADIMLTLSGGDIDITLPPNTLQSDDVESRHTIDFFILTLPIISYVVFGIIMNAHETESPTLSNIDIWYLIAQHIDFFDIARLSQTCKKLRTLMPYIINHRANVFLAQWLKRPTRFRNVMEHHRSFVSGVPLTNLMNCSLHTPSNELLLFCPLNFTTSLIKYLTTHENYEQSTPHTHPGLYGICVQPRTVFSLHEVRRENGRTIVLIESVNHLPTLPFTHGLTTIDTTLLSSSRITSLYPKLLSNNRYLPYHRIKASLRRNPTLRSVLHPASHDPTTCWISCKEMKRSTNDRHCFSILLHETQHIAPPPRAHWFYNTGLACALHKTKQYTQQSETPCKFTPMIRKLFLTNDTALLDAIYESLFPHLPLWILLILADEQPNSVPHIQTFICGQFASLLRDYFPQPHAFRDFMREHNIFVTGSTSLHLWNSDEHWRPNNLDLLCTLHELPALSQRLSEDNFLPLYGPHKAYYVPTHPISYNQSVYIRPNENHSFSIIHVLCSRDTNPISPLLNFPSTALMSYITADTMISLYPQASNAHRAYVQDLVINGDAEERFEQDLQLYQDRGYTLLRETEDYYHEMYDPKCSQLIRCVGDIIEDGISTERTATIHSVGYTSYNSHATASPASVPLQK